MTLLSAINEVCDIVALDRFDSIYGSIDPNAQTMVALAQESGEEISRRGDWRRLLKQQVAIISPMTLPADYQRLSNFSSGSASSTRPSSLSSLLRERMELAMEIGRRQNTNRRLKKDVKKVGKLDGHSLYEYRYKDEPARGPKHVGVMAQEVEKTRPDVVSRGPDGMRRVDYGRLFSAGRKKR
ncbi:hypothetical protein M2267_001595 [Ensifer sp. KUDG1]|uniref:tail fiber domain-containing protein n=1 Tax=Ensifer sp. KUDG1 TaxID=3373919 RepID=UPI003D1F1D3F